MDNQETNPDQAPSASITPSSLFSLLTSDASEAQFQEIISRGHIQSIASMMVLNPDTFTAIIKNKNGTKRVQQLLGISPEVDVLFYHAILSRFINIMTERNSYYAVARAMMFYDQEKNKELYRRLYQHLLDIACTRYGSLVLRDIIIGVHSSQSDRILELVTHHALFLSKDVYGNFVVQYVLDMDDVRTTERVLLRLRGHFVELSFNKGGSYIVEKLLVGTVDTMARVVQELLDCQGDRLLRLARDRFGNFVVAKALEVTQKKRHEVNLFERLVSKLMPFRHLLRYNQGQNIPMIYSFLTS